MNVGGRLDGGIVRGGTDLSTVTQYSYTSDVMTLTDSAAIDVANPKGLLNAVPKGSRIIVSMADPEVLGGAPIVRLVGLVTNPRRMSRGGQVLQLQCSDLGWYLEECDAPLWMNLQGARNLDDLARRLLQGPKGEDFNWGLQNEDGSLNVAWNNVDYQTLQRRLNQGAAGAQRSVTAQAIRKGSVKVEGKTYVENVTLPPLQVEAGQKVGAILMEYARRALLFVNTTPDGALVFFRPSYDQPASYRLEYHDDERRDRNNVLDVTIDDMASGVATDVWCSAQNPWFKPGSAPTDFNADKLRARYRATGQVPHYMRRTFVDADQVSQTLVQNRARWAYLYGLFTGWTYTAEVRGHQQDGRFYAPDTMCTISDSVNQIQGNYYVSACRYSRTRTEGTRTLLTLRKPVLFTA